MIELPTLLRLVRDFVNTAELQLGTDRLRPGSAEQALRGLGLLPPQARLGSADLSLLVGLREGVRELLLGHAGHDTRASVLGELDERLRGVPLLVTVAGGPPRLAAVEPDAAHRVVAAVLTAVVVAPAAEWARLKVCARDSCRWAFFDTSRNRSGRWCSMAGCGNIVKMRRAHRARPATADGDESTGETQQG